MDESGSNEQVLETLIQTSAEGNQALAEAIQAMAAAAQAPRKARLVTGANGEKTAVSEVVDG